MEKGYLNINEVDVDNVVDHLNRSTMHTGSIGSGVPQDFMALKNANLFGKGVTKINNQIGAISKGISNIKSIVQRNVARMNEAEESLALKALDIYVPRDFVVNNTTQLHSIDDIVLNDTINDNIKGGVALDNKELNLESQDIIDNGLSNIFNKDGILGNNTIDDFNMEKETLSNIYNSEEHGIKDLNYQSDGKRVELSNISNVEDTSVKDVQFNMNSNNVKLSNIDNGVVQGVNNKDINMNIESGRLSDINRSQVNDVDHSVLDYEEI